LSSLLVSCVTVHLASVYQTMSGRIYRPIDYVILMLLVLKNFMQNLFTMKS